MQLNQSTKHMLLLWLACSAAVAHAQITYKINDFSDQYFARVHMEKTSKYVNPTHGSGWIAIYSKKTNQPLIEVKVERINGFIKNGTIRGKDVEKSYEKQNDFYYEDVNFDGIKDFAIKNWHFKTDGRSNYKIFLGTRQGQFKFNATFSKLTRGRRGMFKVNPQKQTLTVTKGPYYYSEFEEVFKIINHKPVLVRVYQKFMPNRNSPFIDVVRGRAKHPGQKLNTQFSYYLNPKDKRVHKILTFPVDKSGKRVLLFEFKGRLMYALIRPDSSVEFHYGNSENQFFAYEKTPGGSQLSFQKGVYTIYITPQSIGITIPFNGKTYDWKGDKKKQKGSLSLEQLNKLNNVGQIFEIQDFSNRYKAKVFLEESTAVFSSGWISVYDKANGKRLIDVRPEELAVDFENGKVKANVVHLPYGEQSVLIYKDFNFDGKKDLAIEDGQYSCYHGPSYKIFLATDNGFQYSAPFSILSHHYCGMFSVDTATQTLFTMTKSGCCWHQYSTFKVKNNKPYPIKIVEEGHSYEVPFWDISISQRVDGKMKVTQSMWIVDTSILKKEDNILTYDLNNNKKLRLIPNGEKLLYIFTKGVDTVELYFNGQFYFDKKNQVLSFHRKNVAYKIYGNKIKVVTPGNIFTLPAIKGSIIGSLKTESLRSLDNVKISDSR